jgi:alkylation response protein AidB-like acyl-CoA dehydrogenase
LTGGAFADRQYELDNAGSSAYPRHPTHSCVTGRIDARRENGAAAGLASGETIGTLALAEPDGRWDAAGVSLVAKPVDRGFELDRTKSYVLDGHTADLIVVVARESGTGGDEGLSFFTVPGDAPGLERRLLSTVDETPKQVRLEFSAVRAELLGDRGQASEALARTLDLAAVALANEMVGGAQKLLETSVEYAKTRAWRESKRRRRQRESTGNRSNVEGSGER